jgi:hypothetical protein
LVAPLDATHHLHVSIFAGFVPTADLPKVYDIAGKVLAKEDYTTWKLTAFKYNYVPMGPTGLGGIVIKPTPDPTSPPAGIDQRGNYPHGEDCHGGGILHHSG